MPGAARKSPVRTKEEGSFFVGGRYSATPNGTYMSGQMYVEYRVPAVLKHPYPIVMFPGAGQSGLNYSGTPDGREGWAQCFLRRGYAIYLLDQPSRARSPRQTQEDETVCFSTETVQNRFTAPARAHLWPQAKLHTQWPGTGVAGDPVFDQFFSQNHPSLASSQRQQELNLAAGIALLDKIGPAFLLTHSQAAMFGWLLADARPTLVKAIVAAEPSGPPVQETVALGAPDWFGDGRIGKPYGLTSLPLTYDPPVTDADELTFVRQAEPDGPGLVRCWLQAGPPRKLTNLRDIPILILQAEASYHAAYDHCTVKYLRQAGARRTRFVRLADVGIHGNGHMLMLEKNNADIAAFIANWLGDETASTNEIGADDGLNRLPAARAF
jgi:pimeloyl-ACP methyl ester carboxylesterase